MVALGIKGKIRGIDANAKSFMAVPKCIPFLRSRACYICKVGVLYT